MTDWQERAEKAEAELERVRDILRGVVDGRYRVDGDYIVLGRHVVPPPAEIKQRVEIDGKPVALPKMVRVTYR